MLILIIRLTLIGTLWDQTYLDYVIADWWQSPIIDLKSIPVSSMGSSTECPDEYEHVGQAYFAGTKDACSCQGNINYEVCTSEEIEKGCLDIKGIRESLLPVLNNRIYCARRDTTYNFMTTERPR